MESDSLQSNFLPYSWNTAAPVYSICLQISRDTRNYWFDALGSRSAEVVLIIRRSNGRYLVHTKTFYPAGSYRLMTGGIKPDEQPGLAALRETHEETGLEVAIAQDLARIDYEFRFQGEVYLFTSYLFLLLDLGGNLGVLDNDEEIVDFHEVSLDELPLLANQLESLQGDKWADWGRFRAPAHRIAYQLLVEDNVYNK